MNYQFYENRTMLAERNQEKDMASTGDWETEEAAHFSTAFECPESIQLSGKMVLPPFDYFQARRIRQSKLKQRADRIASLPAVYKGAFTAFDKEVAEEPIQKLVNDVQTGTVQAVDVLRTYGKIAVHAQEKTNCLTEILVPEAEEWLKYNEINLKGPLAGIPVSLKDSYNVKGFDTSVGYASKACKPWAEDGASVKLLKAAGAIPYVKTNLPVTLLSFESCNPVWGAARNPHNGDYVPGGSTGGEGCLLALGGRIGIGSDVAGSVRVPAAWSGIYSLRCSTGRWPKAGVDTSMAGQEGIPSVFSPMTRTLNDLTYFTRALIEMKPWQYENTVHPIEWRAKEQEAVKQKKLRVGVFRTDGVVPPTPAIARAIEDTAKALEAAGHELVEVVPPETADTLYGLNIAAQLLNSDGCATFMSHFMTGEKNDPGAAQLNTWANLWRPVRYLYYLYVRYIKRDSVYAYLLKDFGPKTCVDQWKLVAQREKYRATWFDWWNKPEQSFDFILSPVNATPALPHGAMDEGVSSCGYTFLWNLLDYAAGVMPVGKVDRRHDGLVANDAKMSACRKRNVYKGWLKAAGADNAIARGGWKYYDAEKMHGLPTAVQVVGRRWEEEKVLGYMEVVEEALEKQGKRYPVLPIE
ncbi:hypothetical protein KEM56_006624 [Ascosphaera pollenicola]|nr:hypothetical protein KEM56_006624 [Ascosphaera pollenicola]